MSPAPGSRPLQGRTILLAQGLRLIVRLGSAATLARLLAPHDYGLFGMAAAVFGLLYMAKDLGVITALQQPELSAERYNALCRLGGLGGIALAALGAALAVPTGAFYREPVAVPWVLAALSSTFVFTGLSAPALGMLYRAQRAGFVALLEALAMLAGSIAAIGVAFRGGGVWSLVALNVVQEMVLCVLAWTSRAPRPGRSTAGVNWRSLALFGANLSAQNVATYCARMLDQVVVGRSAGASALGFYGRAAQIAALPVQFGLAPFNGWIVASLAAKYAAPQDYAAFFRAALNSLLHLSLFSAALCIGAPDRLIIVLFGESWLPATPVVRWLGAALAVQPWLSAPVWLLGSRGEVRRLLHWSVTGLILMVAACAVAASSGPRAVAVATAIAALIHASVSPVFCSGYTAVHLRDWVSAARWPAIIHSGFALLLLAGDQRLGVSPTLAARFAVPVALGLAYYVLMILACRPVRRELRQHVFWSR